MDSGQIATQAIPAPRSGARVRWRWAWIGIAAALVIGYLGYSIIRHRPSVDPVEPAVTRAGATRHMVVVFPFDNLAPPQDAYLAEGMADEIIGRLATFSAIGVISRTSATHYDRSGRTLRQIGADLGVNYVLEGTLHWDRRPEQATRVRVNPRLVRVTDDTTVWANSYDRQIDDIFAVQSEIADHVVRNIDSSLSGRVSPRGFEHTENLEAYDYYLQASAHFAWQAGPSEEALRRQVELLVALRRGQSPPLH